MITHKLMIVDDDDLVRETLIDQLSLYNEYVTQDFAAAKPAINEIQETGYDLVIMDVGLPDMDGRDAVRIMRNNGVKIPILMLTGQDSDSDEILGLDAGANDYVTKPFKFAVLLARIRALLRQYEQSEDAIFTIGPYQLNPAAKMLISNKGEKIKLTEKEVKIIRHLYRAGIPVSKDNLLSEVWGYQSDISTHTLETHIYRLRQKIDDQKRDRQFIETIDGGYRLNTV